MKEHYPKQKLYVKNVLLVSQSHTAVDTAAERIKKHSLRLDTNLEIVRFSNNENIVLDSLKNALSNSLISLLSNYLCFLLGVVGRNLFTKPI